MNREVRNIMRPGLFRFLYILSILFTLSLFLSCKKKTSVYTVYIIRNRHFLNVEYIPFLTFLVSICICIRYPCRCIRLRANFILNQATNLPDSLSVSCSPFFFIAIKYIKKYRATSLRINRTKLYIYTVFGEAKYYLY